MRQAIYFKNKGSRLRPPRVDDYLRVMECWGEAPDPWPFGLWVRYLTVYYRRDWTTYVMIYGIRRDVYTDKNNGLIFAR